jgi:hypothetical protein
MKNGRCSKNYPKDFQHETSLDANGFALYRRRNNGRFVIKSNIKLDNRWTVPYNLPLLKRYQAHINIEWCNKSIFIKYLFKYVTKGPDRSKVFLQRIQNDSDVPYDEDTHTKNEIKEYLDTRYICDKDSMWRILGYDIHRHFPAVERLPVHLPDENYIVYISNTNMSRLLSEEFRRRTMLTEWFTANKNHNKARELTYCDFPSKWRWDDNSKTWIERHTKEGKIGRMYYVHPTSGERYYLRMLLLTVKGASDYKSLQTYNNIVYPTFKEACKARGLIGNDQEWYNAFDEAAAWALPHQLRQLFVTMLLYCEVGDEYSLFEKVWKLLCDDIQYNYRQLLNHPTYELEEKEIQNHLLGDLAELFSKCGGNIHDFNLPSRSSSSEQPCENRLVNEELYYNTQDMLIESETLLPKLNHEQLEVFNIITDVVDSKKS